MTTEDVQKFKKEEADVFKYVERKLDYYNHYKVVDSNLYNISGFLILICTALTPILVLADNPDGPAIPKVIQALPASIAGIMATLMAFYGWKDNWISQIPVPETPKPSPKMASHIKGHLGP